MPWPSIFKTKPKSASYQTLDDSDGSSLLEEDSLAEQHPQGQSGFDPLQAHALEAPALDPLHGEHDTAPLLQNDSLAPVGAAPAPSDAAPPPSVGQQVKEARQWGRAARSGGAALQQRRRGQVGDAAFGMAKGATIATVGAFAPGADMALSAADLAYGARQAHKDGGSASREAGKGAVMEAAGFIPVIGPFIGFVEDAAIFAQAIGETPKHRTQRKVQEAKALLTEADERLVRIADVERDLDAYDGADREEHAARLAKAKGRLQDSLAVVRDWLKKKSDHQTLPLLAQSVVDEADAAAERHHDER